MSEGFILIGAFVGIFIFFVFTYFVPVGLWISAIASDVSVSPLDFIGMRFRRVSPHAIINPAIMVKKGGIEIGLQALESHFLAGGNALFKGGNGRRGVFAVFGGGCRRRIFVFLCGGRQF